MTTTLSTTRPSLLSDRSAAVVAATAGVVAAHAEQITARFYPRMFAEHPELLRVFNLGNQHGKFSYYVDAGELGDLFWYGSAASFRL